MNTLTLILLHALEFVAFGQFRLLKGYRALEQEYVNEYDEITNTPALSKTRSVNSTQHHDSGNHAPHTSKALEKLLIVMQDDILQRAFHRPVSSKFGLPSEDYRQL